jgi:hypothetical protein
MMLEVVFVDYVLRVVQSAAVYDFFASIGKICRGKEMRDGKQACEATKALETH